MENLKSIVEEVLGGQYDYEIFYQSIGQTLIETSNLQLENLSRSEEKGVGIRVFRKGKMGFAYTTDMSSSAVKECALRAKEACEITEEEHGEPYCSTLQIEWEEIDTESLHMPLEEKVELVLSLERKALALDSRVKGVRKVSFREDLVETHCINSCGVEYRYTTTRYMCLMSAFAEDGKDSAISYEYRAGKNIAFLKLDSMVQDVVFKAVSQLGAVSMESKEMPVVFFSEAFAMLLETFSPMFTGEALVKGKTPLAGKEGERIASSVVNLVDDGTMKGSVGGAPTDAEGVTSKVNVLLDKGVFRGFLHSHYTARKMGVEPTGNSVRDGFRSVPTSGIRHLYLEAGPYGYEELLGAYDEVLLVLDLMGLHTADPVSGDFSLGASGIIYKGGRPLKSVRGIVIAGNILDVFRKIEGVSSDLKFYGRVGSPWVLVGSLTIGGNS
ncbi:peptidase U62 modulator of DNA gyrase [Thermocrinis albus DSM 14484]|uniref:Peptidase U62 modulator of DNA gyrase n=1 Tax=Thermocrinis albus (strain DSM 14484 / JCM 11386 / HI 11/12) TaxID=638303 RepID=D3SPW7_THEAH|nr:TldD/PmbA family protein [Thermocrinis albus]ADC89204.1 peptidase U62 modulator of DNA gyrase [Thermocrinis albus DSM 14484]